MTLDQMIMISVVGGFLLFLVAHGFVTLVDWWIEIWKTWRDQ